MGQRRGDRIGDTAPGEAAASADGGAGTEGGTRRAGEPGTAGETALAYLRTQVDAIHALDPAVRRAEEDAVHRMRVATRRARSALKSFRRELDRAATDPLAAELKWLAAVLGAARDREVLAARLDLRLAELDPARATEAARRRLRAPAVSHDDAQAEVVRVLDGERRAALAAALEALLAAPPYLPGAAAPADGAAGATVRRDRKRLRRRIGAALVLPPGAARDIALHEARKAAKRARYSAEAVRPVLGEWAAGYTARVKAVQQLLGEHQDSVMCRAELSRLRADALAAGEDPAPYDAIARREHALAAGTEERLPGVWDEVVRA
ncbi:MULTISPECIES: CHAD domain-containing protein [unclassified Streptomyces]|uniref:CHAD domain-containing protein n=1 Tax=unclassified Streptomyces TaxID=2593676 RepID=UPI002E291D91|nr:CHAD domain-containing protein [Streptomyces sp. NBC_00223]